MGSFFPDYILIAYTTGLGILCASEDADVVSRTSDRVVGGVATRIFGMTDLSVEDKDKVEKLKI